MIEKKLFLAVVLFLTVLLLSGCGGMEFLPDAEDNPAETVELVWYTNGQRPADMEMVLAKTNEYLQGKLNCSLKFVFVGDNEYDTKLTTITAAGENYDIADSLPNMFDYRVAAGIGYICPLNELLEKNAPQLTKQLNGIALAAACIKGECYAIPANGGLAEKPCLITNDDVMMVPNTNTAIDNSSELLNLFAQARAAAPGVIAVTNLGELVQTTNFDYVIDGFFPAAVRFADADCKLFNQFENSDYVAVLKTIRLAAQQQYYVKDMNAAESENVLAANNAFAQIASLSYLERLAKNKPGKFKFRAMTANQRILSLNVNRSALVIAATSLHPARAIRLIELLHADKYLKNLLTFGIENRHYEKTADGHIRFLTAHINYLIEEPAFGNVRLDYVPEQQPADKWQLVQAYVAAAVVSPLAGFVVNVQPLKRLLPGLINAVSKYQSGLRSGSLDVDQAVTLLNIDLKANGIDEFLRLLQQQVDEWKAKRTVG